VKANAEPAAHIMKDAYEEMGASPGVDIFTAKDVIDRRGLPLWMADKWRG